MDSRGSAAWTYHVLEWIGSKVPDLVRNLFHERGGAIPPRDATRSGRIRTVVWLVSMGVKCDNDLAGAAATYGHLPLVKWLYARDCRIDGFLPEIVECGNLHILQWFYAMGGRLGNGYLCSRAALSGCLETVKWLYDHGCQLDYWTYKAAAQRGHVHILEWARQQDCKFPKRPYTERSESLTCYAAAGGHLEVLQWLRLHKFPWNDRVTSIAAREGHLEVLTWARDNGCPLDETISSTAD